MAVEFWVLIFVFGLGGRAGRERRKKKKANKNSL